jgi:hypothetical protein
MNPPDPHHEIGDLLRSQKPDPQPSPGLEMKILRALPSREKATRRIWPWFLLPPAVAMGVVMLLPKPALHSVVAQTPKPEVEKSIEPAIPQEVTLMSNPLEREKLALQRDASRAGRFLIDCLPSLGDNE